MKLVVSLTASMHMLAPIAAFAQNAAPTIPGPGTGGAAATTEDASNALGDVKTRNKSGRLDSEGGAASSIAAANGQLRPGRTDDEGGNK